MPRVRLSYGGTVQLIKATVLTGEGMDKVSIETDLPGPTHGEDRLYLSFWAVKGGGELFVKTFFPELPIKVLQR
jgi:hypothetical protein